MNYRLQPVVLFAASDSGLLTQVESYETDGSSGEWGAGDPLARDPTEGPSVGSPEPPSTQRGPCSEKERIQTYNA